MFIKIYISYNVCEVTLEAHIGEYFIYLWYNVEVMTIKFT